MVVTDLDGDAILMSDSGFYYTAKEDDCILSIAERYGFDWESVWRHANNASLRQLRKEANVLLVGDKVFVPEKQLRLESCPTDQCHQFVRKGVPTLLRMRFLDGGESRSDLPYVLTVDGQVLQGNTDKDGMLEVRVPARAKKAMLQLGSGDSAEVYEVRLGRIDPPTELSGARQRLQGLGFDCGEGTKEEIISALRSFQSSQKLSATGDLSDETTRQKLVKTFGC